jgi:hypothetical protein
MSKRFPFTKHTLEALETHGPDRKSREVEDPVAECIGLCKKESFYLSIFLYELLVVM